MALAAGFVQGNISAFIAASLISRLLRYGLVGYVTYRFGTQVTRMIRRNSIAFMLVGVAILVLYFSIKFYFNVL